MTRWYFIIFWPHSWKQIHCRLSGSWTCGYHLVFIHLVGGCLLGDGHVEVTTWRWGSCQFRALIKVLVTFTNKGAYRRLGHTPIYFRQKKKRQNEFTSGICSGWFVMVFVLNCKRRLTCVGVKGEGLVLCCPWQWQQIGRFSTWCSLKREVDHDTQALLNHFDNLGVYCT